MQSRVSFTTQQGGIRPCPLRIPARHEGPNDDLGNRGSLDAVVRMCRAGWAPDRSAVRRRGGSVANGRSAGRGPSDGGASS